MHYHLTTSTPERVLAIDETHATHVGAFGEARKLIVEALPLAGRIEYVPVMPHGDQHVEGYLVENAAGAVVMTVAVSGPCTGQHEEEVTARAA